MRAADDEAIRDLPHFHDSRAWLGEFEQFAAEVETVYQTIVVPAMEHRHDNRPYAFMLRAYFMQCFSWIDWCSGYDAGTQEKQTQRMAVFIRRYLRRADGLPLDGKTANVAVNVWRHSLAHGPYLRMRTNRTTDYVAVAVWRAHDRAHWSIHGHVDQPSFDPITGEPWPVSDEEKEWAAQQQAYFDDLYRGERIFRYMQLGLLSFVGEVRDALGRYVAELDTSARLQTNYERRWKEIDHDEFT